jgi:Fur family transcriptional regulator, peroxide stress response regulator
MLNVPKERLTTMVGRLRKLGCRITPQRLEILRVLAESSGHPSAETVHHRVAALFPAMSLATVYKTIAALKKAGEILELEFSDRDNRYDGNRPTPHPHLVCQVCGAITDPDLGSLEAMAGMLAQATGYSILSHRLEFYGICPACQAARDDAS